MAQEIRHKTIVLDPTVDTSIYASGDLVCEKLTLTNAVLRDGGVCKVEKVIVVDQAKQDAPLDLVFFNSDPDATTFTENVAFNPANADADRIAGVVSIVAADYADFSDNSAACWSGNSITIHSASGHDLYLAVVSRGTPTYATAGDLRLIITLQQYYF